MTGQIQKLAIIGSGNLATNLALAFFQKGIEITQVYSRNFDNAYVLSERVNAQAVLHLRDLSDNIDFILLSVSDNVYEEVLSQLPFSNVPIVHTAGSISIDIFKSGFQKYGVFYPFQTFSKERDIDFKNIPICIEANSNQFLEKLNELGRLISNTVYVLTSDQRRSLHLSGIVSNNFSNFLFTLASEYLAKNGLKFEMLLPLLEETIEKLKFLSPEKAQTGPAVRGNKNVIEKHKELLKDDPQLLDIYSLLSENILNFYGKT